MKHTIKLLTLAAILTAVFGLTGCPGPVNNYIEPPVHEHVFGDWGDWEVVTAATCTENGTKKRTRTCSCGEVEEETAVIVALGHDMGDWGDWVVTVQPTTTSVGKKIRTRTCRRCNYSETWEETIPMLTSDPSDTDNNDTSNDSEETNNTTEEGEAPNDTTEETQEHVHNYVGGGCDDIDCNEHYEFNNEEDYQIEIRVVGSNEDISTFVSLYFSFPSNVSEGNGIVSNPNGSMIKLNDLIKLKPSYSSRQIKDVKIGQMDFVPNNPNSLKLLSVLDSGSPIYVILE